MVVIGFIILNELDVLERCSLRNLPMETSRTSVKRDAADVNNEISNLAKEVALRGS